MSDFHVWSDAYFIDAHLIEPYSLQIQAHANTMNKTSSPSMNEANSAFLREYPKTGPGTDAGNMLRRYWHPVCLSSDLKDLPYPVRMLGEDLVAFRAVDGSIGLVGKQCPHRCASLEYAQIIPAGLQCSYHGWTFNSRGRCVNMPLEPATSRRMDNVQHAWYPIEEWAGVVWCWMGPDKDAPPPLAKIDILTRTDGEVTVERGDLRNYNYLNFMENFADMGHAMVLHQIAPGTVPEDVKPWCDMSVSMDWSRMIHKSFETGYGMKSVLVQETDNPDKKFVNTWSIGFPIHGRFGGIAAGLPPDFTDDRRESGVMLRIVDDTHFEIFRYTLIRPGNFRSTFTPRANPLSRGLDSGLRGTVEAKPYDTRKYAGWEGRPPLEDLVIQESQGAIPPREHEHLATSDAGVAMLRRLYRSSMAAMAKGESPKTVEVDSDGVIQTDTFKGFAHPRDIVLGPQNMPSSLDGRGLIRDAAGKLVFA